MEEIAPYVGDSIVTDWKPIQEAVTSKYGSFGEEYLFGQQMVYYWMREKWDSLGKYYVLYYQRALSRSDFHINNVTWSVFEHVNDLSVIEFAIKVQKYNLDNYAKNDPIDIDTYANLLYKAGRRGEGIAWEEKAAELSHNNKEIVENLVKMKKGEPTWVVNRAGDTN